METNHPGFKFAWAKSVFYNFRRIYDDGLQDCIFFQRDGKTGALAVEIATTYDPLWEGAGTSPIGRNTGLANLKYRKPNAIEVELNWYLYRNSKSELNLVLAEISGDLRTHAMDFFAKSAKILHSDELLQYGLSLVSQWEPLEEACRSQLLADWKAAPRHRENPLYQNIEAALRQFATDGGHPTDDIGSYVNRLLYNFTRPGWSWKNSRL